MPGCRGGATNPIVDQGAGVVLRCPACADVAVRIGVREDALVFEWRGTYTAPRAP